MDFSRDYYAISEKEDTYDVTETEYTNDYFSKDASSYEYAEVSAEKPDKTSKKVQDLESNLNYLMTSYKKMRKQLSLYSVSKLICSFGPTFGIACLLFGYFSA